MMNTTLRRLIDELEVFGRENDAREQDRSRKMLNIEPDTARFISILIRSSKRQHLLEIGTSNGYSTIWLAWAAQATGGHVTSIDRSGEKQAMAEANLKRAGLRDRVDLRLGEASEVIRTLLRSFDFVLFDADRVSAPDQLRMLMPRLLPGALVLADNALSHPEEIAAYLATIEALAAFDHVIVPVGKGLSIAYKS